MTDANSPSLLAVGDRISLTCPRLDEVSRNHSSNDVYEVVSVFNALGAQGVLIEIRGVRNNVRWVWTPNRDGGSFKYANKS